MKICQHINRVAENCKMLSWQHHQKFSDRQLVSQKSKWKLKINANKIVQTFNRNCTKRQNKTTDMPNADVHRYQYVAFQQRETAFDEQKLGIRQIDFSTLFWIAGVIPLNGQSPQDIVYSVGIRIPLFLFLDMQQTLEQKNSSKKVANKKHKVQKLFNLFPKKKMQKFGKAKSKLQKVVEKLLDHNFPARRKRWWRVRPRRQQKMLARPRQLPKQSNTIL